MNQLKELSLKEMNFKFLNFFSSKSNKVCTVPPKKILLLKKGNKLIADSLNLEEVLFVKKGKIELSSISESGIKKVIGIFNKGALLENVSASGLVICSVAITLMDSEVILLTKEMLLETIKFS